MLGIFTDQISKCVYLLKFSVFTEIFSKYRYLLILHIYYNIYTGICKEIKENRNVMRLCP